MLKLAFLIGIYSYLIYLLGLTHYLRKDFIIVITIAYLLISFFYFWKKEFIKFKYYKKLKLSNFSLFIFLLLFLEAIVNLIGVLGPEISFDALWYHLTLPKIFLQNQNLFHIPGGLLYYSDMPKLIDMFYISSLSFGNEILAKFIHFIFGLLTLFALYKLSRKFVSEKLALLVVLIFYSNLVVGWESITAYIDLGRTFFEVVALYQFFIWLDKKKTINLIMAACMVGFAISSKLVAISSILIFIPLIALFLIRKKRHNVYILNKILIFTLFALLIPLPWFIFSYLNTGNPVYPFFSSSLVISLNFSITGFVNNFFNVFDPINPFYLIILPVVFLYYSKFDYRVKLLSIYCGLSILFWFPQSLVGGTRLLLPYLPAFSLLSILSFNFIKSKIIKKYLLVIIILIAISSISYRFLANAKYIPYLLSQETKSQFLAKNLNFNFGDFYDTDDYFQKNIKKSDVVLLYGFHNLYYIDFPFIDSSWVKKGDKFNYIAVQNTIIPKKFSNWKLIYYNRNTNVRLYTNNKKIWAY